MTSSLVRNGARYRERLPSRRHEDKSTACSSRVETWQTDGIDKKFTSYDVGTGLRLSVNKHSVEPSQRRCISAMRLVAPSGFGYELVVRRMKDTPEVAYSNSVVSSRVCDDVLRNVVQFTRHSPVDRRFFVYRPRHGHVSD